ncbi:MAG TPA: MOSC N-terminal beta barrel domain-containing protein [Dokdonella sp.]|uniref:MOSC domain-containing protein n=1 Tax=Dokdonella sp. TaxID=2291710 RepID=UPI002D0C945C|nr:MOSC N-terminal beta barrel domain-containing protein [Dokdonella sp.]HUD43070.1 MOSC N-terminal beta barrel domain-containing protein [Dokdonella sp.]
MAIALRGLYLYPLKSCAPLAQPVATVEPRGLAGDRRWMVVDAAGRFVTGRQQPRLTLIRARPDAADALQLDAPGMPSLRLAAMRDRARVAATVWGSTVASLPAAPEADAWIARFLDQPARFVHMDEAALRPVDPDYGDAAVSYADGFPLLLISAAAMDGLNARLARPLSVLRFRPNLVVDGTEAHVEDGWKRIRIGEVAFDVVKPCTRCVFTTVDFERGERDADGEPLRTLIGYRRGPDGVTFGQNLIPRGGGRIGVGDPVEVLA